MPFPSCFPLHRLAWASELPLPALVLRNVLQEGNDDFLIHHHERKCLDRFVKSPGAKPSKRKVYCLMICDIHIWKRGIQVDSSNHEKQPE